MAHGQFFPILPNSLRKNEILFRLVQIVSISRRQNESDEKLETVVGMEENIVEKLENAGYQHVFLFVQCHYFKKASFIGGCTKLGLFGKE